MARSGYFIRIHSTNANGVTPLGLNGRHRDLPHNKDVAVSKAEHELLENSHVDFEVKGDAKASDLESALDQDKPEPASPPPQVPGGDNLAHGGAEEGPAVVVTSTPVDQVPGGDNLTHGGSQPADEDAAREDAARAAEAAATGDTKPAVVLANVDPNQTGKVATEASLAAAAADAKAAAKPKRSASPKASAKEAAPAKAKEAAPAPERAKAKPRAKKASTAAAASS